MQAKGKRIKAATSVIALLFAGVALTASAAVAQSGNGLTPSPPGAEVYFIDLKDGATIPEKLSIHFGLKNMSRCPCWFGRS